jgi:uncharacterized protein YdaU (DUF1376 family)
MSSDKKVDGWMPLHIGAYMAATGHLSTLEHGMYLLLLMHAWNSDGVIPGEEDRIRRICRADPKEWARARGTIMAFLTIQTDGTYRQKRLETELEKAKDVSQSRSEAGSKGAAARWQKNGKRISKGNGEGSSDADGNANADAIAKPCPIPVPKPKPSAASKVETSQAEQPKSGEETNPELPPHASRPRLPALRALLRKARVTDADSCSDLMLERWLGQATDSQIVTAVNEACRTKGGTPWQAAYADPIVVRLVEADRKAREAAEAKVAATQAQIAEQREAAAKAVPKPADFPDLRWVRGAT